MNNPSNAIPNNPSQNSLAQTNMIVVPANQPPTSSNQSRGDLLFQTISTPNQSQQRPPQQPQQIVLSNALAQSQQIQLVPQQGQQHIINTLPSSNQQILVQTANGNFLQTADNAVQYVTVAQDGTLANIVQYQTSNQPHQIYSNQQFALNQVSNVSQQPQQQFVYKQAQQQYQFYPQIQTMPQQQFFVQPQMNTFSNGVVGMQSNNTILPDGTQRRRAPRLNTDFDPHRAELSILSTGSSYMVLIHPAKKINHQQQLQMQLQQLEMQQQQQLEALQREQQQRLQHQQASPTLDAAAPASSDDKKPLEKQTSVHSDPETDAAKGNVPCDIDSVNPDDEKAPAPAITVDVKQDAISFTTPTASPTSKMNTAAAVDGTLSPLSSTLSPTTSSTLPVDPARLQQQQIPLSIPKGFPTAIPQNFSIPTSNISSTTPTTDQANMFMNISLPQPQEDSGPSLVLNRMICDFWLRYGLGMSPTNCQKVRCKYFHPSLIAPSSQQTHEICRNYFIHQYCPAGPQCAYLHPIGRVSYELAVQINMIAPDAVTRNGVKVINTRVQQMKQQRGANAQAQMMNGQPMGTILNTAILSADGNIANTAPPQGQQPPQMVSNLNGSVIQPPQQFIGNNTHNSGHGRYNNRNYIIQDDMYNYNNTGSINNSFQPNVIYSNQIPQPRPQPQPPQQQQFVPLNNYQNLPQMTSNTEQPQYTLVGVGRTNSNVIVLSNNSTQSAANSQPQPQQQQQQQQQRGNAAPMGMPIQIQPQAIVTTSPTIVPNQPQQTTGYVNFDQPFPQ